MGQMFASWCKHFRAEKSTGGRFCVNVHQSLVPEQDARTALVLEVHLAGREAAWSQRTKSAADDSDLRIRKHHADRRAAQGRLHLLTTPPRRALFPGNESFVGRLVQQRDEVARVAGYKDRTALAAAAVRIHGLRGLWVVRRHALGAELDRRLLQADALDVGHSASGNENVLKSLDVLTAIRRGAMNCDAGPVAAHVRNVGIGLQRELLFEGGNRASEHFWIADRANAATAPKDRDVNSEPMQRLPQLQADDSRADHGHGLRQILPIEYIVTDNEAVTERVERVFASRTRAGRNDRGPGDNTRLPTFERMVVDERCVAAHPVRFGEAIHDRATIDADDAIVVHTEAPRRFDGMGRIGGGDEQLARHAADAGASRAIGAAFDEHCGRACNPGSAVRGKACRPRADDGDVNLRNLHFASPFMQGLSRRLPPPCDAGSCGYSRTEIYGQLVYAADQCNPAG